MSGKINNESWMQEVFDHWILDKNQFDFCPKCGQKTIVETTAMGSSFCTTCDLVFNITEGSVEHWSSRRVTSNEWFTFLRKNNK